MVESSLRAIGGRKAALAGVCGLAALSVFAHAHANQPSSEPPTIINAGAAEQAAGMSGARAAVSVALSPEAAAIRDALPDGALKDAYAAVGFQPVWSAPRAEGGRDWSRGWALLDASRGVEAHAIPGLGAEEEHLRQEIAAAAKQAGLDTAQLDIKLTRAFLQLAEGLHSGVVEPRTVARSIDLDRPLLNYAAAMVAARDSADMGALVESFAPQTADYANLKLMLHVLREAEASGAWGDVVKAGRTLRPMDRGDAVGALRARLVALGDLDPQAPPSLDPATGEIVFDGRVEAGVKAFQQRHGLLVDGVAGANTLAEVNGRAGERARQIAVNMERARWMNFDFGRRHILVNIADYRVELFDGDRVIYESNVVVGQPKHQTPEFSDEMTHVVVNPRWNVPYSIATKELLPELQQDPSELFRKNMTVVSDSGHVVDPWSVDWRNLSTDYFPYRLRQRPGPGNALGAVKFIFPNHHAVYLHDTPAKSLFSKPARAFSHGCVRVAKPVELAEVLLAPQQADPLGYYERIRGSGSETFVELETPVPVHLTYRTAWVDANGALQLRRDVYRRDVSLARALEAAGALVN